MCRPVATGSYPLDDMQAIIDDLAQRIYNGEKITADRQLLRETAKQLMEGVEKGYRKNIVDVAWNSPDFETLEKLTGNIFHFSAAKDYQELQDMSAALRDGDEIRSFQAFREEVNSINGKYNGNWLRSEYDHAITAAQGAARWTDFEKNKKVMPYLEYQAIMDENTRPDHEKLDGTVKHVDDDFWNKWYPPNGWNCRCEAVQLPASHYEETPTKNIVYPAKVQKNFLINFGKEKIVFPPDHPYYTGIPKEVLNTLLTEIKSAVNAYYKNEVRNWITSNIESNKIESNSLYTGKIYVSNEDIKNVLHHTPYGSDKLIIKECINNISSWEKFETNVPLKHERKDNITSFNYYRIELHGQNHIIHVGVTASGNERLYGIYKEKAD